MVSNRQVDSCASGDMLQSLRCEKSAFLSNVPIHIFIPRNFMDAHLDNAAFTQIQDASVTVQHNWHFTSR